MKDQPGRDPSAVAVPRNEPPATSIDSRTLIPNGNTLVIEHGGQRYMLRITRENKLILTK
jgi:hemin uptake protein HemP